MLSLLAIIYAAFISLGLPDSLLGSAWPVMHTAIGAPVACAGIVSMITSSGTILSSLLSDRVIRRFGTGYVTAFSVALTALALFGFSAASRLWHLCLLAIPFGLGAGAVDAALNNYVALHYSSRHMSWLHAFWGVGALLSPNIMGSCLEHSLGWQTGYRLVGGIQLLFTLVLILSVRKWNGPKQKAEANGAKALTLSQALAIPGAPLIMLGFFCMCAAEATTMLWASSWLVGSRGTDPVTAARFASLFFIGETSGRFLNGLIADRFGDRNMIRAGSIVMLLGLSLMLPPFRSDLPALTGLIVLGLGVAPVYPCIIHSTPVTFGRENSQALVGIQMASAYVGSTLMPPLFGLLSGRFGMGLYPGYALFFTVLMLIVTERLWKMKGSGNKADPERRSGT